MPRAFLIKKPNGEDGEAQQRQYLPDYIQTGIEGENFTIFPKPVRVNVGVQHSTERSEPKISRSPSVHHPYRGYAIEDSLPFHTSNLPRIKEEPIEFSELYDISEKGQTSIQMPPKLHRVNFEDSQRTSLTTDASSLFIRELPWTPMNLLFMKPPSTLHERNISEGHTSPQQQFLFNENKLFDSKRQTTQTATKVKRETPIACANLNDPPPLLTFLPNCRNSSVIVHTEDKYTDGLCYRSFPDKISQLRVEIHEDLSRVRPGPDPEPLIVLSDDELYSVAGVEDCSQTKALEFSPDTEYMRTETTRDPRERQNWSLPTSSSTSPLGSSNSDQSFDELKLKVENDINNNVGMDTDDDNPDGTDMGIAVHCEVENKDLEDQSSGRRERKSSDAAASRKYRYTCDTCGRSFSRSNTLTTHKRIHTGDKPFKCETCGRSFRQPGNLTRHRLTHTTVKPYVCPQCDKAFNRASNLHTHMRTHTNIKPFICDFCGKGFHQKIDMKIHRYTHTGEKPHKCAKCGRGFKQLTHLTYHMRTHSESRMYHCQFCGKGFNQKGNLQAHIYGHTGERPFKCDVCGKGFTLASTLNTHKRTHAPKKPFECQYCKKSFYQKNALKTHYLASHPYTGGQSLL